MSFVGISEALPTGSSKISPEGLVLSYDMKTGTSRNALQDLSGQGNHGTIVGTQKAVGPFGDALGFRRTSDYIVLPFDKSLHSPGPISIAVWARLNRLGIHQHLVSYDDLYTLWIRANDCVRFGDTQGSAFESEPGSLASGDWTAFVATFDGTRGTALSPGNIALYVDGVLARGRAFGVWSPGRPVEGYVGKESHLGTQSHLPLCGEIAAVLVFGRALTAREARAFSRPVQAESQVAAESIATSSSSVSAWEPSTVGIEGRTPGRDVAAVRTPGNSAAGSPPRIVRISNVMPPYRLPTLRILESSPLIRFEQWLMCASEKNRRWDPRNENPEIRIFRDWGVDLSHRDMATAHFNPKMIWEILNRRPDLVILGGYEQPTCLAAGLFLARNGIPFLLSSESISLNDSFVGRWAPFLVKKLVQRSAGIIVPGKASLEHFFELGVRPDRIFLAPNAVDETRFAPPPSPEAKRAARESLGLPDKTICLYVGRLTDTKGVRDLLDAFRPLTRRASALHLVIVGEGPLAGFLEMRIANDEVLRETVTLVGYVPEDELPTYYRASDIFVFPTHRDIWGLVLNEAMSAGLPAIATDGASAALDLVEDGESGIIVPKANSDALSEAIARIEGDDALRRRMGQRARERILGGFTPRHQAEGLLNAVMTTLRRLRHAEVGPHPMETIVSW